MSLHQALVVTVASSRREEGPHTHNQFWPILANPTIMEFHNIVSCLFCTAINGAP
jgi:hypothetical protein